MNRKYKFGARYTKGPSYCRLHTNWHFEAHKKAEKSWEVISTNAEQWAHMKGMVAPSVLLEAKKWTHESDITVDSITQGSRVNLLWGKKSHQFRPGHSLEFVINYIWAQNQESNIYNQAKYHVWELAQQRIDLDYSVLWILKVSEMCVNTFLWMDA